MLEESDMDKKCSGRAAQSPGKGAVAESKSKQDVGGAKLFPKTSYGRESVGSSLLRPKPDSGRKPAPQKSKAFDKRPRPRGQYGNFGPKDGAQVADVGIKEEPEFGSVLVPGTKKPNLNHLLNFYFVPRDGVQYSTRNWYGRGLGNNRGSRGRAGGQKFLISHNLSHRPKYNKEQYLQANCQFIVKSDGDYSVYNSDPDLLVQWELIEQIRLHSPEVPSCPICLYPPVAAKMTRCGHVFCWPCILHYLSLSDKPWRKCPICYDAVIQTDLKSVVALPQNSVHVCEEIELQLMRRDRESLLPIPVQVLQMEGGNEEFQVLLLGKKGPLALKERVLDPVHSKLLTATPREVKHMVVEREKNELEIQLAEEKDCPESCFIEQALELLRERESQLNDRSFWKEKEERNGGAACTPERSGGGGPIEEEIDEEGETCLVYKSAYDEETEDTEQVPSEEDSSAAGETFPVTGRTRYESTSSEGMASDEGGPDALLVTLTADDLDISTLQSTSGGGQGSNGKLSSSPLQQHQNQNSPKSSYYFYQAADGQPVFLHSLNSQMLAHEYGSLEMCPPRIKAKVMEKDSASMTVDLRARLRHLRHLPLTSPLEVVEVDLKPLVSHATATLFKQRLEARKQSRLRRAKEESRREKRIAQEQDRKLGKYPTASIRINSHRQFPDCSRRDEMPILPVPAQPRNISPNSLSSLTNGAHAENKSAEEIATVEPVSMKNESSFPSFAKMVQEGKSKDVTPYKMTWNTSAAATNGSHRKGPNSDSESEEHMSVPEYRQSFGEAIAVAIKANNDKDAGESGGNAGGKKKKKQKGKVLFTTNKVYTGK